MDFIYPPELPITSFKKEITSLLQKHQVVVIAGDTGSGKTTQLPKMCLENFPELSGVIGCTQPRRIAAVSVSERVKEELGQKADMVGYKIRFHDHTTANTRIKFMTDGVLLAETRQDPLLKKYGVIIIDEAHERSLNIDFLLGYLRRTIAKRPELKLIITSATIDTIAFAKHFQDAPVLQIEGRTYPVDLIYSPPDENDEESTYLEHCVKIVSNVCEQYPPGDILVFLPTERDIRACSEILQGRAPNHLILPMFGRLQASDQQRIFKQHHKNKIVVATNVAETSITVPGIYYVVDTGLARISSYNPRSRVTSLPVTRVSQASCNQRAGRCGRLGPGICFRLYTKDDYLSRPEFTVPEIQRSNLAEVILQMVTLNLGDPQDFPFLDPPDPSAIRDGYRILRELGALTDSRHLTKYGEIMSRLPIDPVISRIIIEADQKHCLKEIAIIAAALAIQDPRVRPADKEQLADEAHKVFSHPQSDFIALLNIWNSYHISDKKFSWSRLKRFCTENFLSFQRMREWIDLHEQLRRILKKHAGFHLNDKDGSYEELHRSLLTGFFRQCARRKKGNMYQGCTNHEVMIFPGSSLFSKSGDWIISGAFIETSRLYALTVATIEPEWIEDSAKPFCSYSWSNTRWQKKTGQVAADETVSLGGLVIISGRTVNFGRRNKKNIAEARTIFIQKALVEQKITGTFPFLSHNSKLINKWQEAEHKLRKRDIVIEDSAIFDFYHNRLPLDIYDRYTLIRLLKRQRGKDLFMTEQDVLLRTPENKELADYPLSLSHGSTEINLSYCFEPGNPIDGVSALIPEYLLESLKSDVFDWLVPGLLQEKTVFLIKGLPKKIRKHLIPVNRTVDRILDSFVMYRGNYLKELSAAIFKMSSITIHPGDWPNPLPYHLRMRFVILDSAGVELISGHDLKLLSKEFHSSVPRKIEKHLHKNDEIFISRFKDRIFTTWDFDGVPDRIPVYTKENKVAGYLFAALHAHPEKQGVVLSYVETREEAINTNLTGTHYLLQLAFREQFKRLKKHCNIILSGPSTIWFTSVISGNRKISDSLIDYVIRLLFGTNFEPVIDKQEFDLIVERVKKNGFFREGQIIVDQILSLLRQRKEVHDLITRYETLSAKTGTKHPSLFSDLHLQLNEIMSSDFLDRFSPNQFEDFSRYLKSLAIRTERAYANPLKDKKKQEQIAFHSNNLLIFRQKITDAHDECQELYREYQRLVAEFRVSLFSPEIKTATIVSEKKVNLMWKQLSSTC